MIWRNEEVVGQKTRGKNISRLKMIFEKVHPPVSPRRTSQSITQPFYQDSGKRTDLESRPLRRGARQLTGDQGSYVPNCQTNLPMQCPYFWHFINPTAYALCRYEPSSPSSPTYLPTSLANLINAL